MIPQEHKCTYQFHIVIIEVHNGHFYYFKLRIIRIKLLLVIVGVYYYSKKNFFFFRFLFFVYCFLFFSFLFFLGECHKSKTFLIYFVFVYGDLWRYKDLKKIFWDIAIEVIQGYPIWFNAIFVINQEVWIIGVLITLQISF